MAGIGGKNMFDLTAVNYGVTPVLEGSHKPFTNACTAMMQTAIDVAMIVAAAAENAAAKEMMRDVHKQMQAMADGEVSFQIANGDRVLTFVGGDHCRTSLVYAFPGTDCSVVAWTIGE